MLCFVSCMLCFVWCVSWVLYIITYIYIYIYECDICPVVSLNSMHPMEAEMRHTLVQGVGWVVNWGQSVACTHTICNKRAEVPPQIGQISIYKKGIYIYTCTHIHLQRCTSSSMFCFPQCGPEICMPKYWQIYCASLLHEAVLFPTREWGGLKHKCSHRVESNIASCSTVAFCFPAGLGAERLN